MSIKVIDNINQPDEEISKYLNILRNDQRGLFINKVSDDFYEVLWKIGDNQYQSMDHITTKEEVIEYLIGLINGFGIRMEND